MPKKNRNEYGEKIIIATKLDNKLYVDELIAITLLEYEILIMAKHIISEINTNAIFVINKPFDSNLNIIAILVDNTTNKPNESALAKNTIGIKIGKYT